MRQLRLLAPNRLQMREVDPRAPEPGEVRVRVERAGICGTDLALFSGAYEVPLPLVPGHEWTGLVEQVGRREDQRWLGCRVTAEINNHCLALGLQDPCPTCRAGMGKHCQNRTVTGILGREGAFQDQLLVPCSTLVPIPETIDAESGVFVEPLAAAIETFAASPVAPGETLLLLGPGRLGLLVAFVAQARGAQVLVAGRDASRLTWCAEQGFLTEVFDIDSRPEPPDLLAPAQSSLLERVLHWTGGLGADRVVDCSGHVLGLPLALDLVRPQGLVSAKSTPGGPAPLWPATRHVVQEIRVEATRCGSFPDAIALLETGAIPVRQLIEARFPLEQAPAAFKAARSARKVLVCPEWQGFAETENPLCD